MELITLLNIQTKNRFIRTSKKKSKLLKLLLGLNYIQVYKILNTIYTKTAFHIKKNYNTKTFEIKNKSLKFRTFLIHGKINKGIILR